MVEGRRLIVHWKVFWVKCLGLRLNRTDPGVPVD